jgi:Domain of unknown function (DUF4338)
LNSSHTCWNCWNITQDNICPYCEEKQNDITLEFVKRTDARYQEIRDRHYIPNRGTHGQQIHFVIHYKGMVVGIISGASSVYGVKARDEFFRIPKDKHIKQKRYLPAIINNTVFRLEYHEKNLATRVLAKWRKVVANLWEEMYDVPVIGFETFVIEEDYRKGTLYKADNWTYCGDTAGSTKAHKGMNTPSTRHKTDVKMIYCKWIKNKPITPTKEYVSSWKAETPEEKARAKKIVNFKKELVGKLI